jgi:hypothetical protein
MLANAYWQLFQGCFSVAVIPINLSAGIYIRFFSQKEGSELLTSPTPKCHVGIGQVGPHFQDFECNALIMHLQISLKLYKPPIDGVIVPLHPDMPILQTNCYFLLQ